MKKQYKLYDEYSSTWVVSVDKVGHRLNVNWAYSEEEATVFSEKDCRYMCRFIEQDVRRIEVGISDDFSSAMWFNLIDK